MTQEFAKAQAEVLRIYRDALIEKACEWLKKSTILADTTIERFRQAMNYESKGVHHH